MFLNQNASVARLTPDSGDNDKEAYVTLFNNIPINIQPASGELTAVAEGAYGQTFRAFTPIDGIKVGDRITLSGTTKNFIVKAVNDWFYEPIPHLDLTLFLGDN